MRKVLWQELRRPEFKKAREKGERIINAVVSALIEILHNYHSGKLEDRLIWRNEII